MKLTRSELLTLDAVSVHALEEHVKLALRQVEPNRYIIDFKDVFHLLNTSYLLT